MGPLIFLTVLAVVVSIVFMFEAIRRARVGTQQTYYRITRGDDQ